jgi:hypothetical protein
MARPTIWTPVQAVLALAIALIVGAILSLGVDRLAHSASEASALSAPSTPVVAGGPGSGSVGTPGGAAQPGAEPPAATRALATTASGPGHYQVFLPIVMSGASMMSTLSTAGYVDNFTNPSSGWPVVEAAGYAMGYSASGYTIAASQPGYTVLAGHHFQATDFDVSASGQMTSASPGHDDGSFGVYFGSNPQGFYSFEVLPAAGQTRLVRWDFAAYEATQLLLAPIPLAAPANAAHQLHVARHGADIDLWLDGVSLGTVVDSTYVSGSLGLIASGYTTDYAAGFRSFTFTQSPTQTSPTATQAIGSIPSASSPPRLIPNVDPFKSPQRVAPAG